MCLSFLICLNFSYFQKSTEFKEKSYYYLNSEIQIATVEALNIKKFKHFHSISKVDELELYINRNLIYEKTNDGIKNFSALHHGFIIFNNNKTQNNYKHIDKSFFDNQYEIYYKLYSEINNEIFIHGDKFKNNEKKYKEILNILSNYSIDEDYFIKINEN